MMDELAEKYIHCGQGNVTLAQFARKNPWILAAAVSIMVCAAAVIALTLRNNRNNRGISKEHMELAASLKDQNPLLEESVQQAQSANIVKTTFLNNMSHDTRAPMNTIIGFTNIALKQLPCLRFRTIWRRYGKAPITC